MIHKIVETEKLYGTELTVVAHAGLQLVVAHVSDSRLAFRVKFCFQLVCGKGKQLFQSSALIGRIFLPNCFHAAAGWYIDDLLAESEE